VRPALKIGCTRFEPAVNAPVVKSEESALLAPPPVSVICGKCPVLATPIGQAPRDVRRERVD